MEKKIVSLGNFCLPAHSVKDMELKKESYPFDWIISHNDFIIDAIEDGFKKFLDRSYYGHHRFPGERKAGHSLYGDLTFMHRDPRTAEDYEYFIRCTERWRKLYEIDNIIKFIQVIHPPKSYTKLSKSDFEKKAINDIQILKELLSTRVKNPRFLFVILHTEDEKDNVNWINDDTCVFETKCKDNGLFLLDETSNNSLNKIFKDYINE